MDWRKYFLLMALLAPGGCTNLVNSFAFHPQAVDLSQSAFATKDVQEIRIHASDGVELQAFYLPRTESKQVVLFLHGNGGNAYQRIDYARELMKRGYHVLLLSYRGYAKSGGKHTEAGVYRDAEAALNYLRDEQGFEYSDIFLLGRSLGTAVAVEVAQHKPLGGMVLISPLATGRGLINDMGLGLIGWMAGEPFDSLGKMKNIACPVLFIHGDEDRLIRIEQGRSLFEACVGPKAFLTVKGADHTDVIEKWSWGFWGIVSNFLRSPETMQSSDDAYGERRPFRRRRR